MYKILGEDKVMVDRLAPERLEVEYSLVSACGNVTSVLGAGQPGARVCWV